MDEAVWPRVKKVRDGGNESLRSAAVDGVDDGEADGFKIVVEWMVTVTP